MYILELSFAGTWLKFHNEKDRWNIINMISQLETQLMDAAINLSLFESASQSITLPDKDDWDKDNKRKQQLLEKYKTPTYQFDSYEKLNELVEIELKREKWSAGELPRSYTNRFPFIYAKSFLYNLDTIANVLKVISEIEDIPNGVLEAKNSFAHKFPNLRKVRNSSQHIEDRGRSLDSRRKPLQLKPVNNSFIKTDGGVLILESLNGNRFGNSMDNGEYGEVEISLDSLVFVRDCVQEIINSMEWDGLPQHRP